MSRDSYDWRLNRAQNILEGDRISFSRAAWAAAWTFLAIAAKYVNSGEDQTP